MGNREDLLAGAKRCLLEKGYAATTARDIAAASGVSLAAIGYHFGSKDALMNEAVYLSVGDWADEVQRVMGAAAAGATPRQRFELAMGHTLESFEGPGRALWAAQLELLSVAQHNEELRAFLAGIQMLAGQGLAEFFVGISPENEPDASRLAGPVMHSLFIGLMAKYFLDPKQAASAADFTAGMRVIAERLTGGDPAAAGGQPGSPG
jgi:AcrR family transcriptional regulator